MSKILDPIGFKNAIDFVMRPVEGNPIWKILEKVQPFSIDDLHDDVEDCNRDPDFYYQYEEEGFCLICDREEGRLHTIFFYLLGDRSDDPDFKSYLPFLAALPRPLESHFTRDEIIEKLGPPSKTGGDFRFVLGYQRPWIKYYPRENVQLMIEFEGKRIWRVGIGKAFY